MEAAETSPPEGHVVRHHQVVDAGGGDLRQQPAACRRGRRRPLVMEEGDPEAHVAVAHKVYDYIIEQ
jgi:hypothetical protein